MDRVDLDEVLAAIERAYTEVGEIAKQGPDRRWRMSIPAQRDRDSDLLIANALDAGRLVAAELRVAREVVDQVRPVRAKVRQILDDQGIRGDLPASIRRELRQVHADLDGAVAVYDQFEHDRKSTTKPETDA